MPGTRWTASRIIALRERHGETQAAFALRLNIETVTLQKWEQGKGRPSGCCRRVLDSIEEAIEKVFPKNGHRRIQ